MKPTLSGEVVYQKWQRGRLENFMLGRVISFFQHHLTDDGRPIYYANVEWRDHTKTSHPVTSLVSLTKRLHTAERDVERLLRIINP